MKRRKKKGHLALIMLVVFFLLDLKIYAADLGQMDSQKSISTQQIERKDQSGQAFNQEILDYSMGLLDWKNIESLEAELEATLPTSIHFNLKEEMLKLIKGQSELTVPGILNHLVSMLVNEASIFLRLGARFILVVLLCNLLETLSSSFKSKQTNQIAFFVCYMIILLSVIQSFRVMIQLAAQTIDYMSRVMLVCVPILLAFMAASGFNLSASAMAPVIISSLNLMTYVVKSFVLPCIISVIVLEIISTMSDNFKVDKWIALFYKGIKWGLRSILGVSTSLLGLYRLTMPGVDTTLKQATMKFSSAFIPVVGNTVGETIDFITKCSVLIKNTFAAGLVMWILILVSLPLIKILSYVLAYQIAGAMIEPIGDKKMANMATKLGKGCQFIMSCVGIVALFCICSLLICMTISSSGV